MVSCVLLRLQQVETSSGGGGVVVVRWQGAACVYMLLSWGDDATCGADTT
jgi:hypothetical protein